MQEAEEHGDVGVAAGGGHDVHVADLNSDGDNDDLGNNGDTTHLDVGEGALLGLDQGTAVILLLHVRHKSCKQNLLASKSNKDLHNANGKVIYYI